MQYNEGGIVSKLIKSLLHAGGGMNKTNRSIIHLRSPEWDDEAFHRCSDTL